MVLSIFERRWAGDGNVIWPNGDADLQAAITNDVLDAVQVIADVLVDEGQRYRVSFAQHATAYTDMGEKRIVVTSKPMTDGGRTLDDIASIITGFAVHEVGHARSDEHIHEVIERRWPGKRLPVKLCNILQDVRLEAAIVARFPGLVGIFDAAFRWVVSERKSHAPISWSNDPVKRLNFISDAARYQPYTTFSGDAKTQEERAWFGAWAERAIGATDEGLGDLVQEALDRIRENEQAQRENPNPTTPEGGEGNPAPEGGDPTEGDESGEGEGNGGDDESGETPGGSAGGEGDDTQDGDGGSEADDTEGEGKGRDKSGGDSEGKGEGEGSEPGLTPEAKGKSGTMDRTESDGPMGSGAGGSGQAIKDATDTDMDEGLDQPGLEPTLDDLNHTRDYTGDSLQQQADRERDSVWLTAGKHGSMKVRVEL